MTPEEVLKELQRELATRKQVYPKWVALGKLKRPTADHRIAAIEWAIDFIEKNAPLEPDAEQEQLSLFGDEL